jgi:hypothetical protein
MSLSRLSRCLQTAGSYLRAAAPSSIFVSQFSIDSSNLPTSIGLQLPTTRAVAAYGHTPLLPSSSSSFASAAATASAAAFGSMGISADERPFAWLLADGDSRHSTSKIGGDAAADGGTAAGQQTNVGKPHCTQRITEIRGPYHDVVGRRRLSVSSLLVSARQPSSVVAATGCPC